MPYANINATLSQADYDNIILNYNALLLLLPFLINLSKEEKSNLYKMGDKRYTFVTKVLMHANNNPDLVPGFMDLTAQQQKKTLYDQLAALKGLVDSLSEGITDTMTALGNEVLTQGGRPFYNNVKAAKEANVPGADSVYDDLFPFFDLPSQPDGAL